ncbi:MAG TPA: hypothetical protein ENN38_07575 [Actinobacteria bacterium]|nr:hypothetical protein [Actinomycetota bacterium]
MLKNSFYRLFVLGLAFIFFLPSSVFAEAPPYEFSVMGVDTYQYLDNLNNDDAYIFRDKMLARGWLKYMEGYNTQVGELSFSYAAPSDIMYFTGHGEWDRNVNSKYGCCCLTNWRPLWPHPPDSILYWDVDNTWNRDIEWAIFACCHTLRDARWKYTLCDYPRAHAIYGYRDVSYDPTDNLIISRFFDYVPNNTLYDCYRWANQDNDLFIWAIIGHLSNIGDYLHGVKTGATADSLSNTDIYRWYYDGGPAAVLLNTDLKSAQLEASYLGLEVDAYVPEEPPELSPINVKPEVVSEKELKQWFARPLRGQGNLPTCTIENGVKRYVDDSYVIECFPSGAIKYQRQSPIKTVGMSEEEALRIAKGFIEEHGTLPEDAFLADTGKTIQEDLETGKEEVLSYTFTYNHAFNEIPISGVPGDAIVVEVASDGVTYYSRLWREVVGKSGEVKKFMPIKKALDKSAANIYGMIKGFSTIKIDAIEPVYYSAPFNKTQSYMLPAWRLRVSGDGNHSYLYLNAYSGELICAK